MNSAEDSIMAAGDFWECLQTLASAVTLLCATVPLMEVAADENEAPCSIWRLTEVLDKSEWYKDVSRRGAAKRVKENEKTIIVMYFPTTVTQYWFKDTEWLIMYETEKLSDN